MPDFTQQELMQRIAQLEQENSALRDKLDLIYSIVAPDDDHESEDGGEENGDEEDGGLVQIRAVN